MQRGRRRPPAESETSSSTGAPLAPTVMRQASQRPLGPAQRASTAPQGPRGRRQKCVRLALSALQAWRLRGPARPALTRPPQATLLARAARQAFGAPSPQPTSRHTLAQSGATALRMRRRPSLALPAPFVTRRAPPLTRHAPPHHLGPTQPTGATPCLTGSAHQATSALGVRRAMRPTHATGADRAGLGPRAPPGRRVTCPARAVLTAMAWASSVHVPQGTSAARKRHNRTHPAPEPTSGFVPPATSAPSRQRRPAHAHRVRSAPQPAPEAQRSV